MSGKRGNQAKKANAGRNKPKAAAAVTAPKRPPGRPTVKTPEVCQRLFDEIAKCRPVYEICEDPGMPSESTVYKWDREDAEFSQNLAQARARAGNRCGWRIVQIGEKVLDGTVTPEVGRVAADCFLKAAQRLSPKDWGEKVEHKVEGNITETRRVLIAVANLNPEQKTVLDALSAGPKKLPAPEPDLDKEPDVVEDYEEPVE